ncbi:MAG: CHASE domain-containing protein [Pedobacter sp.]
MNFTSRWFFIKTKLSGKIALVPYLALGLSLCLTLFFWRMYDHSLQNSAEMIYKDKTEEITSRIFKGIHENEQILRGVAGLLNASNEVSRKEWRQYVSYLKLHENYPGILGIGFSKWITPAEKDKHTREIQAEGFPNYNITPEGERQTYTSIIYLEPFDSRNQRAFGYDMFSEPIRRAAMQKARDEGKTCIAGAITLVQETDKDKQTGMLIYVPVYKQGVKVSTVEERRNAFIGFAYSPIRLSDLMHAIFNQMPSDIAFELYISDKEIPESLLFSSIQTLKEVLPEGYHPRYQSESKHQAFGRNWRITFKTLPAFSEAIQSTASYAVLTSGILVSCMLTLIAFMLLSAHDKALYTARTYKESEERFKALSEASFGGVIIHENGLILECNLALSTISGFSYSELIGMNGLELIAPESLDIVRTNIKSGYDQDYEVTGVRKDGSKYPLAIRGKNVVYKGRNARVIEFRDITELKRAEMIRQESEQLTHQLLESTDQGIYGIDLDGCCTFINRSALTMLGYDATACLGRDMHDLIHHSYPDSHPYPVENCPIFRAKLTGEGFRIDNEVFWRSDGTSFQAELSSHPIFLDGAINGAVVTFSDITKRKQTESEREAALARVKKLEGIIPICMYCKKIRDDQNSWNQLEQYITNHSEAIFSHGICPHCYEEQMNLIKSDAVAKKDYVV